MPCWSYIVFWTRGTHTADWSKRAQLVGGMLASASNTCAPPYCFWHRMATTTRMALWAESLRSAVGGVLAPHFAYDDDSGTPRTGLVNLRHVPATVRLASLSANGEITYCDLDAFASF
jgi:hypothetical protein